VKLIYHLSNEARQRIFIETGRDPGQAQAIEVDPADLSVEDRRLLVAHEPAMGERVLLSYLDWTGFTTTHTTLALSAPATDAGALIVAWLDARAIAQVRVDAAEAKKIDAEITLYRGWAESRAPGILNTGMYQRSPRRQEWIEAHAAATQRAKQLSAEIAEQRRMVEAHRDAEHDRRSAERRAWALEHGSPRLRKCVEGGYDCQRLYVTERAAIERPGYAVDFDDKAAWKDRSGPSEAALDEAERVKGCVVWLTRFPAPAGADQDRCDEDEACEAVVIREYLGKYDLIKRI